MLTQRPIRNVKITFAIRACLLAAVLCIALCSCGTGKAAGGEAVSTANGTEGLYELPETEGTERVQVSEPSEAGNPSGSETDSDTDSETGIRKPGVAGSLGNSGDSGSNGGSGDSGSAAGSGSNGSSGSSGNAAGSGSNGGSGDSGNAAGSGSNGGSGGSGNAAGSGSNGSSGNSGSGIASGGYYGALQVTGGRLTDANGSPVQLKGVSTHGLAWFPDYVNEDAVAFMHEQWGINVFRLAMYTAESGGYCVSDKNQKQKLEELIDTGVKAAAANQMYIIIDWHILSDGNPNTYKEQAKSFFSAMSDRYSAYDNVIYEICNEPNGGTGWNEVKSYALEVIPVIRANDEDAVIIVGTPTWSQDIDKAQEDPITGYGNIMYAFHFYAATHKDNLRNRVQSAVSAGFPVFVSEFSICDASGNGGIDSAQAELWMDMINSNGLSCVEWSLCNKNETSALLRSSCNKTAGWTQEDLSESGKWMIEHIGNGRFSAPEQITGQGGGGSAGGSSSGEDASNSSDSSGNAAEGAASENPSAQLPAPYTDASGAALTAGNAWESESRYCTQYEAALTNSSGKTSASWTLVITFDREIVLQNGWCGNYSVSGNVLTVTSMDYNGAAEPGGTVGNVGFIVESEGICNVSSAVVTWNPQM